MSIRQNYSFDLKLPLIPDLGSEFQDLVDDFMNIYAAIQKLAEHVDTVLTLTEDIRIDSGSRGLILKDNQATPHYWRVTVSNLGVLQTTDIGTTLPV